MVAKGRQATGYASSARLYPERRPRGERHPKARLTSEQIPRIRQTYADGLGTYRSLARDYGVTKGTIQAILRGVSWRHV
jgi:DNA invertase Pin-like site-specific DNA recombinase